MVIARRTDATAVRSLLAELDGRSASGNCRAVRNNRINRQDQPPPVVHGVMPTAAARLRTAARETVGSTGIPWASVSLIASLSHDGGPQVLVQLDPNATPCPDEPGRSPDEERPRLRVERLGRPGDRRGGHDPRSAYVETFWLPVLGPSTTWLLRHLTIRLEESPEGIELDVEDTARSLGLGERLSPNAPVRPDAEALR